MRGTLGYKSNYPTLMFGQPNGPFVSWIGFASIIQNHCQAKVSTLLQAKISSITRNGPSTSTTISYPIAETECNGGKDSSNICSAVRYIYLTAFINTASPGQQSGKMELPTCTSVLELQRVRFAPMVMLQFCNTQIWSYQLRLNQTCDGCTCQLLGGGART